MTPRRKAGWTTLAVLLAAAAFLLLPLTRDERILAAVLAAAMALWIGEVLPLGVTALASSVALVLLLGRDPQQTFTAYFDPVVVLLLGGFLLGVALRKHRLDEALAGLLLQRVGDSPSIVLLAIMAATGVLSMWVSNTATAAIMLPLAVTLAGGGPASRGRAYVLGVAAAANIGGVGTPIGTPANAIALRFLDDGGASIGFLSWMVRAVPLAAALLVASWLILLRVHPVGGGRITPAARTGPVTPSQWRLMAVFAATVLLWLSTDWHGVDAAVIAAAAAVALFAAQLLDEGDLSAVGWDTLLLIGGSIALGEAVQAVGLDDRLAATLEGVARHGAFAALLALVTVAVLLTLVTSNTAAAVLLVPLALVWSTAWGLPATVLAMAAACAVSFDFLVPMGTPPNALARATGLVDVRGMLRSGAVITVVAVLALATAARWLW